MLIEAPSRNPLQRQPLAAVILALLLAGTGAAPTAMAGPLTDITKREPLPSKDQDKESDTDSGTDMTSTELPSVVIKGKRQQEEETVQQKIEKAIKPKEEKPLEKDLNKASEGMKQSAAWSGDADNYKNHPGDPTTKFPAPVGDETDGCGADITKGCKPH